MPREEKRNWTPEEEELVFDNYYDLQKRTLLPDLLDRSAGAINYQFYANILPRRGLTSPEYYRLKGVEAPAQGQRRNRRIAQEEKTVEEEIMMPPLATIDPTAEEPQPALEPTSQDDDVLENLRAFPERMQDLERRLQQLEEQLNATDHSVDFYLKQFVSGVHSISEMMQGRERALTEYQRLQQENGELRAQIKKLQEENDWQAAEFRRVYDEVDFWLGRFLRLSAVDKVANLADFIPRLKMTFDKFGTLVKVASEMN